MRCVEVLVVVPVVKKIKVPNIVEESVVVVLKVSVVLLPYVTVSRVCVEVTVLVNVEVSCVVPDSVVIFESLGV